MKKQDRIKKKITASDIYKHLDGGLYGYSVDRFIKDGMRYIKAIKEGRMICNIESVSNSGMSRTMKYLSCERSKTYDGKVRFDYLNYFTFFKAMGWSPIKDRHTFRIHGCGMNMVFHVNYTNIHRLHRLGFINKKECDYLAQQTPQII